MCVAPPKLGNDICAANKLEQFQVLDKVLEDDQGKAHPLRNEKGFLAHDRFRAPTETTNRDDLYEAPVARWNEERWNEELCNACACHKTAS